MSLAGTFKTKTIENISQSLRSELKADRGSHDLYFFGASYFIFKILAIFFYHAEGSIFALEQKPSIFQMSEQHCQDKRCHVCLGLPRKITLTL